MRSQLLKQLRNQMPNGAFFATDFATALAVEISSEIAGDFTTKIAPDFFSRVYST